MGVGAEPSTQVLCDGVHGIPQILSEALSDPLSPKPTRSRDFELINGRDTSVKVCRLTRVKCGFSVRVLQKLQSACGIDAVLHLSANIESVLERASIQGTSPTV